MLSWVSAVFVLLGGLAVGVGAVPASAASSRAADSAGSAPIGAASYSAPGGAVYAAPWGSDQNGGSEGSPVRTVGRALALAPSGGTVVLRGGTYHEQIVVNKTVTMQNYPGEAAWVDGSSSVTGWVQDGGRWRHDGWTTRFDHSPTYTKGAPDSSNEYWQFVNKNFPMAPYPDQVFLDDTALTQVASLAQVGPGTFYLDEASSRLYVGSDPNGHRVAASTIAQAMNVRASGVVVRGIGFTRFAPSVWHVGAITLEKPNITFENVVISNMATTGLSLQSTGAQLRKVTIETSGMLGVNGRYADGLTMTNVLARRNNTESFNIAPVSGGVKLGATRGVSVTDSNFSDNNGPGFWEDMSVYNSVFRGSNFNRNAGDGLFLEISARVVVGDSVFLGNKHDGIKVNNTSNVRIWNNTFVGNGRPLDLVQDSRRNTNPSDPAVDSRVSWPDPEMPWQLDSVTASNNVVGLSTAVANCLLCVEDYSQQESAESMKVKANGNAYVRASSSAPTWIAVWSRGAGNPAVFTTLAALRSSTGQEARGREYLGAENLSSAGVPAASITSVASQIAVPLPDDVASLIGKPAGSTELGAWGVSTSNVAPPPTDPAPVAGTTLARDAFDRSVSTGWGTAEVGGPWTVPAASSRFSVASGSGQIRLDPGDGLGARLDQVSSSSADVLAAVSMDQPATGAGHFISVVARDVRGVGDYRAKVGVSAAGDVAVWLTRTVNGSETVISSARTGVSCSANEVVNVRVQAVGTNATSLRAKVWKRGTNEPSGWTVSGSDQAAGLQRTGGVAFSAYTSGSPSGAPVVAWLHSIVVNSSN